MGESSIIISKVMLRNGIQSIPEFISTDIKIEPFRMIVTSGLRKIKITAFVNSKAVPQLCDAARITPKAGWEDCPLAP